MPGEHWTASAQDWQQLILRLLKMRYGVGQFVEVPDTVHGDCGIEGFSRDGTAFQCYAVEEPLAVAERTKRQKAKLSGDLRKLIKNAAKLQRILGDTVLHRWVLVVPRWEDKELQAYADQIAQEVRDANLSFIAADFAASIATGDDFLIERQQLVTTRMPSLRIATEEVRSEECEDWAEANDEVIQNLDRKSLTVCHNKQDQARKLREEYVRHYLRGKNALDKLRNEYPEVYEVAYRVKRDREVFLASESLIPDSLPPQKLRETLDRLRAELQSELPGMASFTVEQLIQEAVADWLLRCPLDFPPTS
jgi:hypothetical protein